MDAVLARCRGHEVRPSPHSSDAELCGLEALQAQMLGVQEGLWCFNTDCSNLSGPNELQLKTFACSGACGMRYCSRECQAHGWRQGHGRICGRLSAGRASAVAAEVAAPAQPSGSVEG